MLIVSVSEGSAVREGGRAREGGKEELENILPCAFGLRLTSELSPLSGEGQHQVQLFTSAACENTLNTTD